MSKPIRCSVLVVALLSVGSVAFAQGKSSGKRFVFGEVEVSGQVQKPQVEYIIARKDTSDDTELTLKESFVPKLLATIDKEPF